MLNTAIQHSLQKYKPEVKRPFHHYLAIMVSRMLLGKLFATLNSNFDKNQFIQSLILTVPFRDGMILLDRSDKGKWGKIDFKLFALNESNLNF